MDEWVIEPFEPSHERSLFACGKPALDAFLHSLVSQYEKRKLGRTYVAARAGEKQVLGYYTLASSSVAFEHLPASAAKKLPRHSVPVALLARLAVDHSVRGKGLGKVLMIDALTRCMDLSSQLGIHAVEVDAIDEEARQFYQKYGFLLLGDSPLHLYLPITAIEKAFGASGKKK